jgi:hypothetical protein
MIFMYWLESRLEIDLIQLRSSTGQLSGYSKASEEVFRQALSALFNRNTLNHVAAGVK